jgi:hypothetical protein
MQHPDTELFRSGSVFYAKLPDGLILSVGSNGKFSFVEKVPGESIAIRPYPYTGIDNVPPSSVLEKIELAVAVAQAVKQQKTEEQKSAS